MVGDAAGVKEIEARIHGVRCFLPFYEFWIMGRHISLRRQVPCVDAEISKSTRITKIRSLAGATIMTGFPLPTVISIFCGVWDNGQFWRMGLDFIAGTTVNSPFKNVLLTLCFLAKGLSAIPR